MRAKTGRQAFVPAGRYHAKPLVDLVRWQAAVGGFKGGGFRLFRAVRRRKRKCLSRQEFRIRIIPRHHGGNLAAGLCGYSRHRMRR